MEAINQNMLRCKSEEFDIFDQAFKSTNFNAQRPKSEGASLEEDKKNLEELKEMSYHGSSPVSAPVSLSQSPAAIEFVNGLLNNVAKLKKEAEDL